MSYNEEESSPQSVREKVEQAGEIRKALRSLSGHNGGEPPVDRGLVSTLQRVTSYWWIELAVGVLWMVIAVVVLKFNHASVTTVGILTGIMFLIFAAEEFLLAVIDRHARWLWAIFGVLLTAAGIIALIHPRKTFAGFADILGFVFLLIATLWMVQAFAERSFNDLWWLTLISGILMIGLAFWVSGQFFLVRAYTLLIFAGIWAMTTGVIAIVRAFQIREVGHKLSRLPR